MTEDTIPRRAKLELLVRKTDGEGDSFEVKEVRSAAAFVQLRPQRVADDAWELADVASRVSGQQNFILKNRLTERYLLLSEPERFLCHERRKANRLREMRQLL